MAEINMSIAGITVPRAVWIIAVILFFLQSAVIAGIIGVQARIAAAKKKILFFTVRFVDMSEKPFPFETNTFAIA